MNIPKLGGNCFLNFFFYTLRGCSGSGLLGIVVQRMKLSSLKPIELLSQRAPCCESSRLCCILSPAADVPITVWREKVYIHCGSRTNGTREAWELQHSKPPIIPPNPSNHRGRIHQSWNWHTLAPPPRQYHSSTLPLWKAGTPVKLYQQQSLWL